MPWTAFFDALSSSGGKSPGTSAPFAFLAKTAQERRALANKGLG